MPDCGSSGFFDSSLPFPLEAEDEEYYNETHVADEDNSWADELTALLERVQPLTSPSDAFAAQLLEDMRVLTRLLTRDDRPVDVVVLATRLAAVGYRVVVRTAIGGGDSCFRNLHNEFLCVTDIRSGRPVEYIADPLFLSHFKISNPTQLYAALFERLPAEFVGTAPQLTPLVQLLCSQMHASFKQQSLTLPPWRQARSMLSKWLPARVRDSPAVGPPASPQQHQQPQLASSQPPVLHGGSQQRHALDELRQPSVVGGSCTATSPTQLKKSLLAGRMHLAPTKSLPPSIVVTPSPFRGQPPTYKVKMGA